MFEAWEPVLGLSEDENARAVAAGFEALQRADYERRLRRALARDRDSACASIVSDEPIPHARRWPLTLVPS